ncbi:MAG: histidine kinase [bacterium]
MLLSAELTLYPLQDEYLAGIKAFIEKLNTDYPDLRKLTFPTATIIQGSHDAVMACISEMLQWNVETNGKAALVVKFLPGYEAL